MGTCWNCNTQITLAEEQTTCDSCGSIIYYKCNSCKEEFKVEDRKTKKKLKECKLCGYFFCPSCGVCSWSCSRYTWEKEILQILSPEVTQGNCINIVEKVREIVNYFEEEKGGKERRVCTERGVLISYAKNRIKTLLAKVEGFRVKNKDDRDAFIKRLEETTDKDIGTELKISDVKEDGSYGQEYRDAFNLLVCMGKLKIVKKSFIKNNETIEYDSYIRIDGVPCKLLSTDNLIINECQNKNHHGNKRFPLETTHCPTCPVHTKGKNKGQQWELKKRLNNEDICQLYRGSFIKKK